MGGIRNLDQGDCQDRVLKLVGKAFAEVTFNHSNCLGYA